MAAVFEWIRFIIVAGCFLTGLFVLAMGVLGVYKFHYVLNRMHAAAMGDTLGILIIFLGLVLILGFSFGSLKFILVIMLLWLASPVASHMISRLEVSTNEELEKECEIAKKEDNIE